MARTTISQRIALTGGEAIEKQLKALGEVGEKAFAAIQAAAEKLKGPGAEFARNMDRARERIHEVGQEMQRVGEGIRNFGAGLSVGVTAPVLGAAAAMQGFADRVRDFQLQAQLSNTTVEQFQRLAHAARTVGVEQDKLGDIFKDVQDKVGDFLSTGGGEMADFFEQIAPKVGITAEQFRKLSGPAALQAYFDALEKTNVSQSEMVFYLEALASDASLLIPLLRDSGREFERLGEKAHIVSAEEAADLKAYNAALLEFRNAVDALAAALATSGITEMMTDLVEWVTRLVELLSETNPELLRTGAIIAGLAATFAPLLAVVGLAVQGIAGLATGLAWLMGAVAGLAGMAGTLGTALAAVAGVLLSWPVLIVAAAAALGALAGAIYARWDDIVQATAEALTSLESAVRAAMDGIRNWFGSAFDWVKQKVGSVIDWISDRIRAVKGMLSSVTGGGSGGGSQVPGFADGGRIRGPGTGTSDSILARLSSGEFVVRARAVQHYGPRIFDMLNRMSLPRGLLPGFAAGGLVAPVAVGGGAAGDTRSTINLSIGGEVFAGLTAPRETAERLIRFATTEEAKRAGRRPAWYEGN